MQLKDIQAVLETSPFVPLTLTRDDGAKIKIPYQHVAIPMRDGLLIFQGVKSATSHSATGKEFVAFDRIERIEPANRLRKSKSKK